jgi:hypothetical protein
LKSIDNFVLINNNAENAETEYDPQDIKRRFFDTAKAKGKPKTPEELAKKKAEVEDRNKSIQQLLQQKPKFTPSADAVVKIKAFIK